MANPHRVRASTSGIYCFDLDLEEWGGVGQTSRLRTPRHSDVDEMGGAILENGGLLLQDGKKRNGWAKERR